MTKWRLMEPEDLPAVKALHKKQCEALGVEWDMGNPFHPPMMLTLVHLDDSGEIDQAIEIEAVAEAAFIGVKPLPRAEYKEVVEQIAANMKMRGIKMVRSFVLRTLVEKLDSEKRDRPMTRLMKAMGFTMENDVLQQFYRRP